MTLAEFKAQGVFPFTSDGHHTHTFICCKINIFKGEKETLALQRGEWRKQIFCMILSDIWLHRFF